MSDKNEKIEAAAAPKAKAHFDFTKLNTLAVVSLASAATGFGAIAAVITGHISLAQLKKSNESGRGMALTGMILGYVGIGIWVIAGIGMAIARMFIGQRFGVDMPGGFDGGMHGGHHGGFDNGMYGPYDGGYEGSYDDGLLNGLDDQGGAINPDWLRGGSMPTGESSAIPYPDAVG